MRGFSPLPVLCSFLLSFFSCVSEEEINLLLLVSMLGFDQMVSIGGKDPKIELEPVPES